MLTTTFFTLAATLLPFASLFLDSAGLGLPDAVALGACIALLAMCAESYRQEPVRRTARSATVQARVNASHGGETIITPAMPTGVRAARGRRTEAMRDAA